MNRAELIEVIKQASQAYYSGQPIMSDARFDQYVMFLKALDPTAEILTKTGYGYEPTVSNFGQKFPHVHGGMGSILNKPKKFEDIPDNLKCNVRVSAKLDGLSGVIHVASGKVIRCLTRGNGELGLDKTDKFKEIEKRYSCNIPEDFTGEIRGEFIISNDNWKKLLVEGTDKKNPRNAASGIINAKGIMNDIKYLDFIPYKVIYDENNYFNNCDLSKIDLSDWFYNFPKLPYFNCKKYNLDEITSFYLNCKEMWPCDGIVITSQFLNRDQGRISYNECAYKFETLKAETEVIDIEWNLSKQNFYIPTAILKPVEIGGSTISRATLFNTKFVIDNKISKGAKVLILKAGDIIPKIEEVIEPASTVVIPNTCPICGSKLLYKGVNLVCVNKQCGNNYHQDLKIWCMNIGSVAGFSETLLFKYLDRFNINQISDIYNAEISENQLRSESVQSNKFLEVFKKLTEDYANLSDILLGLNIPRFGQITVNKLVSNNEFIKRIKVYVEGETSPELENSLFNIVEGICGEATAKSLLDNKSKLLNLLYFKNRIIYPTFENKPSDTKYLCVTGKLNCGSRKQFEEIVKKHGFEVKDEISKKISFLITNNANTTSSKFKKAKDLGIKILNEEKFLENHCK